MARMSMGVRVRLSIMMFVQYAIHAVWIVPLARYLGGSLSFTGSEISMVANTAALGALLAPIFVGMVADRFFASQRVLGVLNLASAGLLFYASRVTDPRVLFGVLLIQQLCYMPTWAITNSIAIANCEDTEKDLPSIRVMGSIGWVVIGYLSLVAVLMGKQWDATSLPMLTGAILSLIGGVFAFVLPHTPPPAAGKKSSVVDVLGLRALALLKSPSFVIFILCSLIIMVPFATYWTFFSLYLGSLGVQAITFTMGFGQFAEIFLMLLVPLALKRFGVKWTLIAGVVALALRYVFFLLGNGEELMFLNYAGIIVHGIIFGFFFVTGYIYVDRVAPKEIRAQGQALIMLVTFGAGLFLGNYVNGKIMEANAIPGEPVAQGYAVPADLSPAPALTIEGAKVSDSVAYSRALSDQEILLLNAQQQKKDLLVERLEKEFGDKVKLDEGKVTATTTTKALTFSTWLELPEAKEEDQEEAEELSGTIFKLGEGDKALQLGLEKGRLSLQAGATRLAQVNPLPRGKKVHVAGSFDGKLLRLFANGKAYTRYHWKRVWVYPAIIAGALVLFMAALFHVPPAPKEEEEAPSAEEPKADAAEAEAEPEGEEGEGGEGDA